MSRKKVGVFCLFLFFTFFIIVPKVEATEEMKTKFTVTPVLPENQVSGTSSYYDLIPVSYTHLTLPTTPYV